MVELKLLSPWCQWDLNLAAEAWTWQVLMRLYGDPFLLIECVWDAAVVAAVKALLINCDERVLMCMSPQEGEGGGAEEDNGWLTRGRVTNCRFTLCPYSISCLCVSRAEGGNGLMSIKGVNKWNYTEKYTHTHDWHVCVGSLSSQSTLVVLTSLPRKLDPHTLNRHVIALYFTVTTPYSGVQQNVKQSAWTEEVSKNKHF